MKITALIMALFCFLPSSYAIAEGRCPANDMGCTKDDYEQKVKDRIDEGKKEVREASGPVEKAKAAGRTVRDCTDCGMKVITDSIEGSGMSK